MPTERKTLVMDSQQLNTYQQCPRKYYWSFVRNIESVKKRDALSIGGVFHDLFEFVNKGLIEKKSELKYLIMEALTSVNMEELSSEEKTLVMKRFLEYYKHYKVENSQFIPIASEEGFSKTLYEDDNVLFVYEGRMDLVAHYKRTDQIVWWDYKTTSGHKLYKHTNQFIGYTWALGENACGFVDYIGKQQNQSEKTFERELVQFHQTQIERWKQRAVRTFWSVLQDNEFIENPSSCEGKYGVCSYHKLCERDPEIREQIIQINYQPKEHWSAW